MISLALSLVVLAIGPVLHRLAFASRSMLPALDSFVFVAISGLVLLHILPHSIALGGWAALLAAHVGFIGPGLAERLLHRAADKVHLLFLFVALVGFGGHAFLDGLALAPPPLALAREGSVLSLAIIIHRLPDGLVIWWLLREPYGSRAATSALLLMASATVAGFFVGDAFLAHQDHRWLEVVQALVAGSLIHVVIHRPHASAQPDKKRWPLPEILGALGAGGLLWVLAGTHETASPPAYLNFIGRCGFIVLLFIRFGPRWLKEKFFHGGAEAHRHQGH